MMPLLKSKTKKDIIDTMTWMNPAMQGLYQNNQDLVNKNVQLLAQLCSAQQLCQDLWIQHVADRIHQQKLWKDGWIQGYEQCKKENIKPLVEKCQLLQDQLNDISKYTPDPNKAKISPRSNKWLAVKNPSELLLHTDIKNLSNRVEKEILHPEAKPMQEVFIFHGNNRNHSDYKTRLKSVVEEKDSDQKDPLLLPPPPFTTKLSSIKKKGLNNLENNSKLSTNEFIKSVSSKLDKGLSICKSKGKIDFDEYIHHREKENLPMTELKS